MKLSKRIDKVITFVSIKLKNKNLARFLISASITVFTFVYILLRYKYVSLEIPLWYTRLWGDGQLALRHFIFLIPATSLVISLFGFLLVLVNKRYIPFIEEIIWMVVIFCNVFLAGSVFRIIQISSIPFKPLINPLYLNLFPYFLVSFLLIYLVMPYFIDFAQKKKIITNPSIHVHPGMILQSPSARGGGFVYSAVFLIVALIFVGFKKDFIGLYLSVLMVAILGIIDDYQNTHPSSNYRAMENPILRLFLLFLSVLPVVLSGVSINSVTNPFGGMINLNIVKLDIMGGVLPLIPILLTAVWVVWLMNVLSWSNGVDGQYGGIVGIASLVVAFLALRFEVLEPYHLQVAILAVISAGAAFGSVRFNWHPSQIMWGFGAVSAGLVIASLAILSRAKITVSVLIVLIPFLDAIVTVIRRIFKGRNPFKGDSGHLHHILLNRGWSVSRVALFYWGATIVFGIIGLLTPEKDVFKYTFIIAGVVAFLIALLNVRPIRKKQENKLTTPPQI